MSRLYILVRNDLHSMNPGKAIAQASHCVSQFVLKHPKDAADWAEYRGFGTTIVLEGSQNDIEHFTQEYIENVYPIWGDIIDPTYPFKLQREIIPYLVDNLGKIEYDETTEDQYGMVNATRTEYTASWFFLPDVEDEKLEELKTKMEECNIKLFR